MSAVLAECQLKTFKLHISFITLTFSWTMLSDDTIVSLAYKLNSHGNEIITQTADNRRPLKNCEKKLARSPAVRARHTEDYVWDCRLSFIMEASRLLTSCNAQPFQTGWRLKYSDNQRREIFRWRFNALASFQSQVAVLFLLSYMLGINL